MQYEITTNVVTVRLLDGINKNLFPTCKENCNLFSSQDAEEEYYLTHKKARLSRYLLLEIKCMDVYKCDNFPRQLRCLGQYMVCIEIC